MVFGKNGNSGLILGWYLTKMAKWSHFRMVFGKIVQKIGKKVVSFKDGIWQKWQSDLILG